MRPQREFVCVHNPPFLGQVLDSKGKAAREFVCVHKFCYPPPNPQAAREFVCVNPR